MVQHAYVGLADRHYWRPAVAQKHPSNWDNLVGPNFPSIDASDAVVTAGSCFAQHISKELMSAGCNFLDYEPAPASLPAETASKLGYGLYSARYGNVYNSLQFQQLVEEALSDQVRVIPWASGEFWVDALRSAVSSRYSSTTELEAERVGHIAAVRDLLTDCDVLVFTLGLTECWTVERAGQAIAVPSAPGIHGGDPGDESAALWVLSTSDVVTQLLRTIDVICGVNSTIKFIFTVSPVPLTATATDDHVLVANMRSKSVLRAAIDDVINRSNNTFYFPSFEIISSHASRGMYFNSDLRTVSMQGVDTVMRIFRRAAGLTSSESISHLGKGSQQEVLCDDDAIWGAS